MGTKRVKLGSLAPVAPKILLKLDKVHNIANILKMAEEIMNKIVSEFGENEANNHFYYDAIIVFCKDSKKKIKKYSKTIEKLKTDLKNENVNEELAGVLENLQKTEENINALVDEIKSAKSIAESSSTDDSDSDENMQQIFDEGNNEASGANEARKKVRNALSVLARTLTLIDNAYTRLKNAESSLDDSPIYPITSKDNPCHVLMIANSSFIWDARKLQSLPAVSEIDVPGVTEAFQGPNFKLDTRENVDNKAMHDILKMLQTNNYTGFSSLLIIFDSHGAEGGTLFTKDGHINISDIWNSCQMNHSLGNKPVIIIAETCRGKKVDRVYYEGGQKYSKATSFQIHHPGTPNYLVVFACADGFRALVNTSTKETNRRGSYFLCEFLKLLRERPDLDLLSQLTESARRVLQGSEAEKESNNQTVTFLSLLPKQFRFSVPTENAAGSEIRRYEISGLKKMAIVAAHPNFDSEAVELANKFQTLGFEIESQRTTDAVTFVNNLPAKLNSKLPQNLGLLVLVFIGLVNDEEVHETWLKTFRKMLGPEQCRVLMGKPKLIMFLGPEETVKGKKEVAVPTAPLPEPSQESQSSATMPASDARVVASDNSDVLAYCDQVEGWKEAMLLMLGQADVSEDGFVQLLTRVNMTRPQCRRSAQITPHLESSLTGKIILNSSNVL